MQRELQITLSDNAKDCDGWDAFVASTPHSDLLQSSLWAQLKATIGWHTTRLVVRQDNRIVGGAQILKRSLPLFLGAVGYVPRGPILLCKEPDVVEFVVRQLRAAARRHRLQALVIQPPHCEDALTQRLVASGFGPSATSVAPAATLRIDLTKDCDTILAQMKSGVRYNIRRSEREGITVRDGSEADLGVFSQLHAASSERQGFSTYSEEYFVNMWRLFAPSGNVHLFVSEYEGEAVSAMLVATFGDTVWGKRFGWSGKHGRKAPNEALIWRAVCWAKEQGYRYFDHDGIAQRAAVALVNDGSIPDSVKQTPTYFKLGFGGEALVFPDTYACMYNPLVRFAYTSVYSKVTNKSIKKKVINYLRLG